MPDDRSSQASIGFMVNRAVFRALSTALLVGFGWLAGWYLQGHSAAAWSESNYFSNPYRIGFLVFLFAEMIVIILLAPRQPQVTDDAPRSWYHWRLVMGETLLVLAVFSDCMGILPVREDSTARWAGVILLAAGLLLYSWAGASRRKTRRSAPESQFPTLGIFRYLRFPESLAAIFYAFGTALVFNTWTGLFLALISVVVISGYVNAQDNFLLRSLRSPWAAYQSKVKRLIPFIW
jgi:protein-S-isoprenylcysteine O-methyltransferase Ste14